MSLLHLDLSRVARVSPHSAANTNGTAWSTTEANSQRVTIAERLQELEDEWTIEGMFEATAAVVGVATFALGLAVDDRWLVLPLVISVLLLQQTLQGWCPLLPLLRGLGFRTEREVHMERDELRQMEEDRAAYRSSVGMQPETPSLPPSPVLARASFSLRDFLLGAGR